MSELEGTKYIEFKPITMHTLRHSFATRAAENNINQKVLQGIMGHSDLSTTMQLYVHNTDEHMKNKTTKIIPIGVKMA